MFTISTLFSISTTHPLTPTRPSWLLITALSKVELRVITHYCPYHSTLPLPHLRGADVWLASLSMVVFWGVT
ncbi:hypothetical protein E2C01_072903 [Portunus trituberculatus]|uniref:Uncharacterized protein n=1 Tax=Portunus trituberculatus TaxID=210409 RepID=A0A5B7IA70_PORTR|nr:hypothetical protein [Portunus trituberculatus]